MPLRPSTPADAPHHFSDRDTGATYPDAFTMVDAYLGRYCAGAGHDAVALDATGYAQLRRGVATIGVNVLEDNGVLMILAPMLAGIGAAPEPPHGGREALYRRLLELSFLATSDAAFAIDATKGVLYVRALRRLSGLDYEEFEDLLNTVGEVTEEWEAKLRAEFGV